MEYPAPKSDRISTLLKEIYHELKNHYIPSIANLFDWMRASGLTRLIRHLFVSVFLNPYLRTVILMAQSLWLILGLLLIAYWPISVMDQANDAFRAIVSENGWWAFYAHLTTFTFALLVWFSCRMLLILFDLKGIRKRINASSEADFGTLSLGQLREFIKWTPPFLGVSPFLILLTGLAGVENSGVQMMVVLVEIVVYFYVLTLNTNFIVTEQVPVQEEDADKGMDYLSLNEHTFGKLRVRYQLANYFIVFLILILFVAFSSYGLNVSLSRHMGVVAVFFTAMSMWVFLAYSLMRLDYTYKVPIAVVVLAVILFFWNTNNHQIRTCAEGYVTKEQAGNLGIARHFAQWVDARHDSIQAWRTNKLKHGDPRYPVYIIASEGGGLRAAYWTTSVLGQLSRQIPDFYDRVYALSTVSGGSVGAAVYTKLYRDSLEFGHRPSWAGQTVYSKATTILKQDYLSPLVGAFLVPDMTQKLLPVGVSMFDRARYLEDALSDEYRKVAGEGSSLDTPFMHVWAGNDGQKKWRGYGYRHRVPSLFMNCTRVEDGEKAILSNLAVEGPAFQGINNQNVLDLQDLIHKNIPIKTAAFMSARFPIVTPPATIQANTTQRQDLMTIVDGGYIDNSGLETALSVITSIRRDMAHALRQWKGADHTRVLDDLKSIELHLILIKSSEQSNQEQAPNRGLYEIRGPLMAFFNSWDINIGSKLNVANEYLRLASREREYSTSRNMPNPGDSLSIVVDEKLVMIDLNRKQQVIPLGWFLSDTARRCVNYQASLIGQRFSLAIRKNLRHEFPKH